MNAWIQVALLTALVLATAPVLGRHLWQVFDDRPQPWLDGWLTPVESSLLRWVGDRGRPAEQAWDYLRPLLLSNLCFGALAFLLLLFQPAWLNPQGLSAVRWDTALHTAISFLTNTDQQHYTPEQTLSDFTQLGALQFPPTAWGTGREAGSRNRGYIPAPINLGPATISTLPGCGWPPPASA